MTGRRHLRAPTRAFLRCASIPTTDHRYLDLRALALLMVIHDLRLALPRHAVSVAELVEATRLPKATASRIAQRLARAGLLTTADHGGDGRKVDFHLTPRARAVLRSLGITRKEPA